MSSLGLTSGHVRQGVRRKRTFAFNKGDLVLVKWTDGMVYFAKIKHIYHRREKCVVVFDDKSQDEADFTQIHSVDETTTDIICIKCKRDDSESPNEIVLCDMCGIGFHQKCHNPIIPASALQLDSPWNCSYCHRGAKCPFLTESLDVLQNLLSDDNESINSDDQVVGMESEGEELSPNKSRVPKKIKKHRTSQLGNLANDRRMSLRTATPTSPKASSLVKNASSGSHGLGPETPNSKDERSLSEDEDGGVLESLPSSRKRKKYSTLYQKRIKRSSVESHTVSVTRLDSPFFVGGSCDISSPHNKEEVGEDSSLIVSQQRSKHENKALHVSLSLPGEVETKRSLKSPLSSIGSLPSLDAPSLSSKISPAVESDDVLISDLVKCESAKQQPTPAPASPPSRLDLSRIVTASSRLLTLADVGISENPIRPYAANNPELVGLSKISAAQLPEKSVVIDEATSSPCLAGTSSKLASPVLKDDMAEQPSVETLFTDPCAPVPTANSALLSSVQQTSDADAVNGSGLEEGRDKEMKSGAFDGTTTQTSNLGAEEDPTTCNSSANCCKQEVSISSGSIDKEACDTSCVMLPSMTTNPDRNPDSEMEGTDTKTAKKTHPVLVVDEEHGATQPAINREGTNLSKQNSPVSDVPSVTNSLPVQSSGKEDVAITMKPRPSKLFIKSPRPNIAGTPGTTSARTHSKVKLQILSPNKLGRECGQMTPLDSELASLGSSTSIGNVGYSGKRDSPDNSVRGDLVSDGMDNDHHTSVAMLVSKAVELAAKKTAHDDMTEKLSSTGSTSSADPDVIITGVEPSKEASSRRDSALCRPSSRHLPPPLPPAELSKGAACAHLTHSKTVALCTPALPVANFASHQVQATTPPVLDQRVGLKSPAHAVSAHNRYQRVPLAVHCRSKSSTHPSSSGPPLYYASVNPDMMTSMTSKQVHSTNVSAAKPFAIVNALPMSSSEALQKQGEGGDPQFLQVYNDGNGLSHVIPASMLQQYAYVMSPDATVGSEPAVPLPNNILSAAAAKKEEYIRKKIRAEDIQSIQKKIGDAFNTFSETMLVSAFNEAWEKFQANAIQYKNSKEAWKAKVLIGNQFVDGKAQVQAVTTRPIAPKPATTPVLAGTHSMPSSASSPYIPTSVLHGGSQKQQYILQPLTSNLKYPTLYAISSQPPHTSAAETSYPSSSTAIPALPFQSDQTVVNRVPVTSKTLPGDVVTTKTLPGGLVTAMALPTLGLTKSHIPEHQHAINQNLVALPSCSSLDERHKQWQQKMLAAASSTSNKPASLSIKYKSKKPNKMCAKCGKNATFLCSGCRHEWYCGRDCQLRNWDQHADHCKA